MSFFWEWLLILIIGTFQSSYSLDSANLIFEKKDQSNQSDVHEFLSIVV